MRVGPPPGWYPDPAGGRQWRVWNGAAWTGVTRPYGDALPARRVGASLGLVRALRRVVDLGVVGVIGGLALLVGVLDHLPGSAEPLPTWFAGPAGVAAVGLLALGTVVYAGALRELRGRWTLDAWVPGLNYLVVGVLAARRLGRPSGLRVVSEVVLLVLYATSARADAWLDLAPVIVALGQGMWLSVLIDRLTGPADSTIAS
ncbi:MAG TPA: DUF2510 domain-containing protein [Acidimicrobiales bacterium]|nr:DUF2510 domain-containing protein [Acidimicrobiales bacterium]